MSKLGEVLYDISQDLPWEASNKIVNSQNYNNLLAGIEIEHIHNGWFIKKNILLAIENISSWLNKESLSEWINPYDIQEPNSIKTVAIIMAGNIPMVGFHDFVSVFLSGHKTLAKLSTDDKNLLPLVIEILKELNPEFESTFSIVEQRMSGFDAVIATGSDNSSLYFESYFGKYPHIIRKNRTSLAIIGENETEENLNELGHDIFSFFGLGCRNVSFLMVPDNFVLDRFFEGIFNFGAIVNHNKYANNYDYNKAVYLLNRTELLDNGFVLLKEDESLHSPLGMIFYKRYKNKQEVESFLEENKSKIQAILGEGYIPFGKGQAPALNEYADGIDTIEFLKTLN